MYHKMGFILFRFKCTKTRFRLQALSQVAMRNFTALHRLPSCEYENGVVRGRGKIAIEENRGRVAEWCVT